MDIFGRGMNYRLSETGIIVPACGSAGAVGHLGEAWPSRCELRSDCFQMNVAFSARASHCKQTTVETERRTGVKPLDAERHRGTGCDISGPGVRLRS